MKSFEEEGFKRQNKYIGKIFQHLLFKIKKGENKHAIYSRELVD